MLFRSGRLMGDTIVRRLGARLVIVLGGLFAAAGIVDTLVVEQHFGAGGVCAMAAGGYLAVDSGLGVFRAGVPGAVDPRLSGGRPGAGVPADARAFAAGIGKNVLAAVEAGAQGVQVSHAFFLGRTPQSARR